MKMPVLAVRTVPGQSHSTAERDSPGITVYAKTNNVYCPSVLGRAVHKVVPVGGDDTHDHRLTSLKNISAVSTPENCCPVEMSVKTADPTVLHGDRWGIGTKR